MANNFPVLDSTSTTTTIASKDKSGVHVPKKYTDDGDNESLGGMGDTAATTDNGTFSLIALFKRLLAKITAVALQLPAALTTAGNLKVSVSENPGVATAAAHYGTATHAAATLTYAAGGAGVSHVIDGVAWSYSGGTPAAGKLTITDDGTTVFEIDIGAAVGQGSVLFPKGLKGTANKAMVVTLADAGVGIVGKVNALGKRTAN